MPRDSLIRSWPLRTRTAPSNKNFWAATKIFEAQWKRFCYAEAVRARLFNAAGFHVSSLQLLVSEKHEKGQVTEYPGRQTPEPSKIKKNKGNWNWRKEFLSLFTSYSLSYILEDSGTQGSDGASLIHNIRLHDSPTEAKSNMTMQDWSRYVTFFNSGQKK